ncbi:hypothetical protein [Sulfitobacter sp.]|uniref:hypothetical protein n=1 Tax=Sulfitobacter sp. TaxID=1903071 RepID=UPI003003058F
MQRFDDLWATIDGLFWLALGGGVLVKLMFSEKLTTRQVIMTVCSGVFCAVFFSKPILDFLKLDGEHFEYAIVAVLALTGEHLVRRVVQFSRSGTLVDVKKGLGK